MNTLDQMIEQKLANGEYASGSIDTCKNERDVIIAILASPAVHDLTIYELNGLKLHVSRAVRESAQMAIDLRNGGTYNLQTGKVEFSFAPSTPGDNEILDAIQAITRATRDRV